MNTHKTVRKALFSEPKKVELRSQQVNLAVADDLKKYQASLSAAASDLKTVLKDLKDANNKLIAADKEADKVYAKSQMQNKKASDQQMKAAGVLEKAEKAAKDLGVDFKQIAGYNEVDKLYDEVEGLSKEITSFVFVDIK